MNTRELKKEFNNALIITSCAPMRIKASLDLLIHKYILRNIDLFIPDEFQVEKTYLDHNVRDIIYYKYSDIGYGTYTKLKKSKPDIIILIIDPNLKDFYIRLELLAFFLPARTKLFVYGLNEERRFPDKTFYINFARKFFKFVVLEIFCYVFISFIFFLFFLAKVFVIFFRSGLSKKVLCREMKLWLSFQYRYNRMLQMPKAFDEAGTFLPLVFFVWLSFITTKKTTRTFSRHPKRIFFIRLDHIGDVISSTPALRAIRLKWPKSFLTLAVGKWSADIIKHCPYVNEILVYPTNNKWHLRGKRDRFVFFKQLLYLTMLRTRKYDLAIDPCGWPETYKLMYMSGAKLKIANDYGRWDFHYNVLRQKLPQSDGVGLPETKRTLSLLKLVNVSHDDISTEVWLTLEEKEIAKEFLRANNIIYNRIIVGIHPGAPWPQRRWPIDRFAQIANRIAETYKLPILIFAGPGEEGLVDQLINLTNKNNIIPVTKKSLRDVVALIERCGIFICNDSGPMHIAVACKVPTVAIFGPGGFARWSPPTPPHIAIRNTNISCSPCSQISCDDNICLKSITVDQVWEAVTKLLINENGSF